MVWILDCGCGYCGCGQVSVITGGVWCPLREVPLSINSTAVHVSFKYADNIVRVLWC